jgi:hypothetical protein
MEENNIKIPHCQYSSIGLLKVFIAGLFVSAQSSKIKLAKVVCVYALKECFVTYLLA